MTLYQIQEAGKAVSIYAAATPAAALESLNADPMNPWIYAADGVDILPIPTDGGHAAFGTDCEPMAFGDDADDVLDLARDAAEREGFDGEMVPVFVAPISPALREAFENAGFRTDTVIEASRRDAAFDLVAFLGDGAGDSIAYAMTPVERERFAA